MQKSEIINSTSIAIKEYRGQRVVTFKDIDAVHKRPGGTARKRFSDNREHFVDGEDYFKVKCSEVRPFFGQTPPNGFNPDADIVLMTESGYLMLAKAFTDELAWKVQKQLVNGYFRARELQNQFSSLSPQLQTLINIEMRQQEAERRMAEIEASNAETSLAVDTIKDALDSLVSLPATAGNWKSQFNRNVRGFCMQTGRNFNETFNDLYAQLDEVAGVRLDIRLENARKRLEQTGATKADIAAISKLGIVAQDKRLMAILTVLFNNMVAVSKLSSTNP